MSQKIVLDVQLNCEKCKQRAMETVAGVEGVVSVAADLKDQKMTVIGDPDPVCLTASLRKFGYAQLVSVGPSKEPAKPAQAGKPDNPKPDAKPASKPESKENHTYVILPTSCHHCSGYTYYLSDENPNACCIV